MILNEFDGIMTAELAREISQANQDESIDREDVRTLMSYVKHRASIGRRDACILSQHRKMSESTMEAVRELGFTVFQEEHDSWDKKRKVYNWIVEW